MAKRIRPSARRWPGWQARPRWPGWQARPRWPGWQAPPLARLLLGPSTLRRPSDRLEGLIAVLLSAVLLAAIAAASCFAVRFYRSERADAARLHPATAVLTRNGPADNAISNGMVTARWRAPDGRPRSGTLTTALAPGITGARAGTRVPVWLTGSGQPQDPPARAAAAAITSVAVALSAVCGVALVLLLCYWLCRLVLDRRRYAAWASEWSTIGPKWTTRR
jgi:hypothetical protein